MTHIQDSIIVKAPPDLVFAFGRDPRRWASWWANLEQPPRIRGTGSTGSKLDYVQSLDGVKMHIKTKVLKDRFEADGSGHWWATVDGPIHGEQHWDYLPCDGGVAVVVAVDYTMDDYVSKVVDQVAVEHSEEQTIHQTLENLRLLVEH